MKTKTVHRKEVRAKHHTVNGQRMVTLSEEEDQRLLQKADLSEPLLPEPLPDDNYPAREYMEASLARKIIRHRRRLGLTQVELARRAGIRPETLNRAESGKSTPSIATIEKIDRPSNKQRTYRIPASGRPADPRSGLLTTRGDYED